MKCSNCWTPLKTRPRDDRHQGLQLCAYQRRHHSMSATSSISSAGYGFASRTRVVSARTSRAIIILRPTSPSGSMPPDTETIPTRPCSRPLRAMARANPNRVTMPTLMTSKSLMNLSPKPFARCRAIRQAMTWEMLQRRSKQAGLTTHICNHTFRATGITAYLTNGGAIERAAIIAGHASINTTKLFDRRPDDVTLEEIEKIRFA